MIFKNTEQYFKAPRFDLFQIMQNLICIITFLLIITPPAHALSFRWLLGGQKTETIDTTANLKADAQIAKTETTVTTTTSTSSSTVTTTLPSTTTTTLPAENSIHSQLQTAAVSVDFINPLYAFVQLKLSGGVFPIKDFQGHILSTVSDDATIEIRVPMETLMKASLSTESDKKILTIKEQTLNSPLEFFNGNDILSNLDLAILLNGAQDYSIETDHTNVASRLQYVRVLDGGYSPNFRHTINLRGYLDVKSLLKKQNYTKVYRYLSKRKVKVRIRSRKGVRYAYKYKKEYTFGKKKTFGSRVEISGFQLGSTVVRNLPSAPVADDQLDQGFEPGDEPISNENVNNNNVNSANVNNKDSNNKIIEIVEDDNSNPEDSSSTSEQDNSQIDNAVNITKGNSTEQTRVKNAIGYLQKVAKTGPAGFCFRYIKAGLVFAGLVKEYPGEEAAKNAGPQLLKNNFINLLSMPSFRKKIKSPFDAPEGAILVYHGYPYGHIEMRTADGFISDYFSPRARTGYASDGLENRGAKLIGVYIKTALN